MLASLIAPLIKRNIETEFPARLNLFLLLYAVKKIIYLLLAIATYFIFIKFNFGLDLFILTITSIFTLYIVLLAASTGIGYLRFCQRGNKFVGLYSYLLSRLATRIEAEHIKLHRLAGALKPCRINDMKIALSRASLDIITHNKRLKKSLNMIVIYYCVIFYVLFLAYDYVYFKVTDITFQRFWQAVVWAYHSLGHTLH